VASVTTEMDSEASDPSRPHVAQRNARGPELPPGLRFGLLGGSRRAVARFLAASGASMVLCALLYRFAAPSFTGPTDIVSYSTFANWNFQRQFWATRLIVYGFPLFTIIGYALLARFGPLRSMNPRPAKRTIELVEPVPPLPPASAPWLRVLLPAVVVAGACAARTGHLDLLAVGAGVAYVVFIFVPAEVWARRTGGRRLAALSVVNGVGGAVAAVLGLWFVSAHTVAQTAAGARSWPWLVWWLPALGVAAIVWWSARELRRGRVARDVELTLLTVVVGAVAVFLAISVLPGQIAHFSGFDDGGQEMAGASLVARGYFPWRDMFLYHGPFLDAVTGSLGRAIFGDSIWGVWAIHSVILIPLFWVGIYLFAVWVSRRNPWFLALTFAFLVVTLQGVQDFYLRNGYWLSKQGLLGESERFIGVPVTLIVLGETLRRRSVPWVVGLTLLLFVDNVLVPETAFLTLPALACVLAADLVHRRPDRSLWTHLRLSRWCVGTGLAAVAVWAGFLAAFGALRPFIDYYIVCSHEHNLSVALPPTEIHSVEWKELALGIGCVLLTVWAVAVKVANRASWEARDWVAVAAAAFAALYLEKSLGRFAAWYVWQWFGAALPIVLLWMSRLFDWLGRQIVEWRRERDVGITRFAQPVAAVLIPLIALVLYAQPLLTRAGAHHPTGLTESSYGRLGYAAPTGTLSDSGPAIDTGLLRDLDTSIRAYAGDDGPVFDMTQIPGYLYFVLGRVPGTRFVHVDVAYSEYAQRELIDDLKASRPPVVIYDATSNDFATPDGLPLDVIGYSSYDGFSSTVRNYDVSEYVLRGWAPVVRTHRVLVMARNDLAVSRPAPALTTPPQTTDLYFSGPSCRWGAAPNYLLVPDSDRATTLPVRPATPRMGVHYSGWAVDSITNRPASTVLIADGDRIVDTVTPSISRPDVPSALHISVSGFQYNGFLGATAHPSAYLVGADGLAHRLAGAPSGSAAALRLPDGRQVGVAPTVSGKLEIQDVDVYTVGELQLPNGINLRDYDLAKLSAGGPGVGEVVLTDGRGDSHREISAKWLDQSGPNLSLRVGSCPQWYGYDPSRPLYVLQRGGSPVTSVTLSFMRR
jgi:hypothetical protein